MKSITAVEHELASLTWVAVDPGKTGHSRNSYERQMVKQLSSAELNLEWIAAHPIYDAVPRYVYSFGHSQSNENALASIHEVLKVELPLTEHDLVITAKEKSAGLAENLRFVKFPSEIEEFSIHSAEELIRRTAIEEIIAIGGSGDEEMIVETFNHLRPVIYNGALTLFVEKSWDGNYTPIERPTPHECCGGEEH